MFPVAHRLNQPPSLGADRSDADIGVASLPANRRCASAISDRLRRMTQCGPSRNEFKMDPPDRNETAPCGCGRDRWRPKAHPNQLVVGSRPSRSDVSHQMSLSPAKRVAAGPAPLCPPRPRTAKCGTRRQSARIHALRRFGAPPGPAGTTSTLTTHQLVWADLAGVRRHRGRNSEVQPGTKKRVRVRHPDQQPLIRRRNGTAIGWESAEEAASPGRCKRSAATHRSRAGPRSPGA